MKTKVPRAQCSPKLGHCIAMILCAGLLLAGIPPVRARHVPQEPATAQESVKVPAEQLDALVAPIALYPDPLLSQTLVASTYPLEIIQLQQWLNKHKDLSKDQKKLADEVKKQPWDPSIQAMAALPDVANRLADDIQWTTDLGNAFLAQQSDVMDAVQRMRAKAKSKGALESNEQQKVETQVVESKQVIVIEQANPQVIYVPSYNPTVVYGPPVYAYPPIYYPPPPSTGAVVAASAISFGVGLAVGAAWGGGWGWGCGWGGNDINVNVNNNFNRNTNISGGNRTNISGGNKWQHNPTHRGGAPYADRATANKFGGSTNRSGAGNRGGVGSTGGAGGPGGGGDRVGDRSVQGGSGMGDRGGSFGGGSGGFNGASTRASSSRGSSSMGGGGGSRGGGGGGRGGGGGGRR